MHDIDDLNAELTTSYGHPDFVENGYRFHFRGFIFSEENGFIGIALAWPDQPKSTDDNKYFAQSTGGRPHQYQKGSDFSCSAKLWKADLEFPDKFRQEKQSALTNLKQWMTDNGVW